MSDVADVVGVPVPALSCTDVSKSYSGTRVLTGFEATIAPGEVHALLGENGSGKSTFIKILAGVVTPDAGSGPVRIGGEELGYGSPHSSLALGGRFVHQDLGLIAELSVADNMLLVAGFATRLGGLRMRENRRTVEADLARIGLDVDPRALVRDLSPATRTGVAVARALHMTEGATPKVLVLDEPTATLPDDEVQRLMAVVRSAQAVGIGILYVTHRLDEVFELDGTVTVLRDGHRITTRPARELDKGRIVALMAGAELTSELSETGGRAAVTGPEAIVVRGLRGDSVDRVDLVARRGEIVGIAGITGSGREAILPLLFGALPRDGGEVEVDGHPVPSGQPGRAVRLGLGYLPPDRKIAGFPDLTVTANATLADLGAFSSAVRVDRKAEWAIAVEWTERMSVRPAHAQDLLLSNLSGGNQQKVLFAKWLRLGLSVFLLDDPTQGVDVNAKALLHRRLVAAVGEGLATVVASTDVDELASLCDRVLVLRGGRVAAELAGNDLTARAITVACLDSGPDPGIDTEAKVLT